MTGIGQQFTGERLNLRSRISDLAQVPPWIARLALQFCIPESTQFAMDLCLEEVLSNIIRHGYANEPDHSIAVRFEISQDGYFQFVVEDEAPPFNPVDAPALPAMKSLDQAQSGGQGLRLLREFADALEYQAIPTGNRLSIRFASARSATSSN